MINRTLSVASAANCSFLGLLTFTAITALSVDIGHAADACRTSPSTETPAGGHWRYRLEKGTGQKCWYLAGVSDAAKVADEKPVAETKPASVATKLKSSEMQPSVADARAELATSESPQLNATVWPPLQNPPDANLSQDTNVPSAKQNTVLAQRWPEPNSVRSSDDEFVEKMRVAANTTAQEATPVPPEPIAAPSTQDAKDESVSNPIRILLVAVIGALALIAVLLRSILSYLSKRRRRNAPRRPIWDDLAIDAENMPPYIPRSAPTQPAQYADTRHQRYAYRDDEEAHAKIEHLLRRAAHREQH